MSERVICLGDSNTEGIGDDRGIGWPIRLAQHLAETQAGKWNVTNLGVAGDTSIDIKHRLFSEVLYRTPQRLIIAAGVNDTAQRLWPDSTGHKVDFTYARVVWMDILDIIEQAGIRTAFVSPLPVDESRMPLIYMPHDDQDHGNMFTNSAIQSYIDLISPIITGRGHFWIDVMGPWKKRDFAPLLSDGLHPNAHGYDLLAEDITKALTETGFF